MDLSALQNDGWEPTNLNQLAPYQLDTMEIAPGMSVDSANGCIGNVDEVVFDATSGRTTHFLVRKGGGLTRDALIPVEWIARRDQDRIVLAVRTEQVDVYADRPFDNSESEDESPTA